MEDHSTHFNEIDLGDDAESMTIVDTDEFNSQELAQDAPLEKDAVVIENDEDSSFDHQVSINIREEDATTDTPTAKNYSWDAYYSEVCKGDSEENKDGLPNYENIKDRRNDSLMGGYVKGSYPYIADYDDATTETPFERIDTKSRDPEKTKLALKVAMNKPENDYVKRLMYLGAFTYLQKGAVNRKSSFKDFTNDRHRDSSCFEKESDSSKTCSENPSPIDRCSVTYVAKTTDAAKLSNEAISPNSCLEKSAAFSRPTRSLSFASTTIYSVKPKGPPPRYTDVLKKKKTNRGVEESVEAPSTPTTLVVQSSPPTTDSRVSKPPSATVVPEPMFIERHEEPLEEYPHLRTNYQLMIVSILLILIGFVLLITVIVLVFHPIAQIFPWIITSVSLIVLGSCSLGINITFCKYLEKKIEKKNNFPIIYARRGHLSSEPIKDKQKK